MADTKISDLTAASALDGTEAFPVVQSGATKKATVNDLTAVDTFTPEWSAATDAPTYTLAPDDDFDTYYYGKAPHGLVIVTGNRVHEEGRVVTGSRFGTFDPGEGWYYIPLQYTPHPSTTGAIGKGQIGVFDGGTANLSTVLWEVDPVLDMASGLASPGEQGGVIWAFLTGVDWDANATEMVVSHANPGTPDDQLILAWNVDYIRAS